MRDDSIRTTITFPSDLIEEADRIVQSGNARSRNDLVVQALRRELATRERARIDAEFLAMADDPVFQAEDAQMAEEMISLEWDELKKAESEP
jgi:metal-responsive CopG/Arc/MetJ family transcriptional regulator